LRPHGAGSARRRIQHHEPCQCRHAEHQLRVRSLPVQSAADIRSDQRRRRTTIASIRCAHEILSAEHAQVCSTVGGDLPCADSAQSVAGRRSPEYGLSVVSYRLPLLNPEFPTTVLQPSSTTPSPKRRTRGSACEAQSPDYPIKKSPNLQGCLLLQQPASTRPERSVHCARDVTNRRAERA